MRYLLIILLLAGCGTSQPKRVSTGVALPRIVALDDSKDNEVSRLRMGLDADRGNAMIDSGAISKSTNFGLTLEISPIESLAIGLRPFYGSVDDTELDTASHIGLGFYGRWRAINFSVLSLYIYPGMALAQNAASDTGWTCVLLICGQNDDKSRAYINVREPSLGAIVHLFRNGDHSVAFVGQTYWTRVETENIFSNVREYAYSELITQHSLMGYYMMRYSPVGVVQVGVGTANRRTLPSGSPQGFNKASVTAHLMLKVRLDSKAGTSAAEGEE